MNMTYNVHRHIVRQKIIEAAARIVYTYTAHWKIANRLQSRYEEFKIAQIALTASASCGFLTALIKGSSCVTEIGGMLGGACSFLSLCLNLYMLNFDLPNQIKQHTEAANELWEIRECYVAFITDFDMLSDEEVRSRRDDLTKVVAQVNKKYPGTDRRSYAEARVALKEKEEQTFNKGEAERLLNLTDD